MKDTYTAFDDTDELIKEHTDDIKNFLKDLETSPYDKEAYIKDYEQRFKNKLDEFFDTKNGKAFEFSHNDALAKEFESSLNQAKKDFMLHIYSYASFGDFCSFNDYKKSAGENNALNYLSHIPKDFHKDLYGEHQELFDRVGMRDLKYNEVDTKVEELFFELHNEVNAKFESKVAELNEKLPLFVPDNLDELYFLTQHFSYDTMDLSKTLAKNHIDLADKKEEMHDFLQDEVFGSIHIPYGSQEPYDEKSIIFDEPCVELFALEAKQQLKNLGYEVAIFKDIRESKKYNGDFYIFAYANNKEDLQKAFSYILEKEDYEFDEKKSGEDFLSFYHQKTIEAKEQSFSNSLFNEEELKPTQSPIAKNYDEIMERRIRKRGK